MTETFFIDYVETESSDADEQLQSNYNHSTNVTLFDSSDAHLGHHDKGLN